MLVDANFLLVENACSQAVGGFELVNKLRKREEIAFQSHFPSDTKAELRMACLSDGSVGTYGKALY